jgi:CheY-like chemotaxis protein
MELTIPMSRASDPVGDVISLHTRTASVHAGIRALLALEDALVRAGVRALLAREADVIVVADVSRGEDAIAVARELRPDVIVTDIRLPGLDALQATRQILAKPDHTHAKVLLLGGCDSDDQLFGALRAGASRTMLKLHARDRAQLVMLAYQTRLVEPRRTSHDAARRALLAA